MAAVFQARGGASKPAPNYVFHITERSVLAVTHSAGCYGLLLDGLAPDDGEVLRLYVPPEEGNSYPGTPFSRRMDNSRGVVYMVPR